MSPLFDITSEEWCIARESCTVYKDVRSPMTLLDIFEDICNLISITHITLMRFKCLKWNHCDILGQNHNKTETS